MELNSQSKNATSAAGWRSAGIRSRLEKILAEICAPVADEAICLYTL